MKVYSHSIFISTKTGFELTPWLYSTEIQNEALNCPAVKHWTILYMEGDSRGIFSFYKMMISNHFWQFFPCLFSTRTYHSYDPNQKIIVINITRNINNWGWLTIIKYILISIKAMKKPWMISTVFQA